MTIAAAVWSVLHPQAGFREPEQLPHNGILQISRPYLGQMVSVLSIATNRDFPELSLVVYRISYEELVCN